MDDDARSIKMVRGMLMNNLFTILLFVVTAGLIAYLLVVQVMGIIKQANIYRQARKQASTNTDEVERPLDGGTYDKQTALQKMPQGRRQFLQKIDATYADYNKQKSQYLQDRGYAYDDGVSDNLLYSKYDNYK
eukprot:jgi/Chrzof1/7985/UNPLg00036.t1